jgi:hypothetical protein
MRNPTIIAATIAFAVPAGSMSADQFRRDHVVVVYDRIARPYAEAIGRVVAAARNTTSRQYGFDMPPTILVSVTVDERAHVKLFNDGRDRILLIVRSEQDLRKPAVSGFFNLYGMCHEVGHMAMYRLIPDHTWMTVDAAEGWAHYLGSRLVDAVYSAEGGNIWPDHYNYIEDGTKRLEWELASDDASGIVRGAASWKQLAEIVGDKGIAPIFVAWGRTRIDRANPASNLGKALLLAARDQRTRMWWQRAKDLLIDHDTNKTGGRRGKTETAR